LRASERLIWNSERLNNQAKYGKKTIQKHHGHVLEFKGEQLHGNKRKTLAIGRGERVFLLQQILFAA